MTNERKMWFGKYKGESIRIVCEFDRSYITWCLLNVSGFYLTDLEQEVYDIEEGDYCGSVHDEFVREMTSDMMNNFD